MPRTAGLSVGWPALHGVRTSLNSRMAAGSIVLEPCLPTFMIVGRPSLYPIRALLNAIFYVVRSSWAWRLLEHAVDSPLTTTSGCGT
jgi:hypothetical protein